MPGTGTTPAAGAGVPGTILPLDVVRRSIADHMLRSRHTSAHVTTVMEADLSRVIAHRQAHKEKFQRDGVSLTFTAYFAAAAVTALKQVPLVNASWSDQGIVLHRQVNVGVAVSLGDKGLIVPVIRDADQLSLQALARRINELAERARSRKLRPEEVQGGTFTITNHGTSGSLLATPIINQPQSAILGVGVMQKRVVVLEGKGPAGEPADSIAIRPMVYLTLTFDHRILDGAIGDQFLGLVVQRLQQWS
jgi:2-oxoglutarate dehydrogenase E2 component (dihydrolipoamide succinyltransferase)